MFFVGGCLLLSLIFLLLSIVLLLLSLGFGAFFFMGVLLSLVLLLLSRGFRHVFCRVVDCLH